MKTKHLVTTAGIILTGSLVAATTFAATNSKQKQDNTQVQQHDVQTTAIYKDGTLSYIDENGETQAVELSKPIEAKDGTIIYEHKNGQGNDIIVQIDQPENTGDDKTATFNDGELSYVDENGETQTIDLSEPVESKDGITTYQYKDDQGNDIIVQTNDQENLK